MTKTQGTGSSRHNIEQKQCGHYLLEDSRDTKGIWTRMLVKNRVPETIKLSCGRLHSILSEALGQRSVGQLGIGSVGQKGRGGGRNGLKQETGQWEWATRAQHGVNGVRCYTRKDSWFSERQGPSSLSSIFISCFQGQWPTGQHRRTSDPGEVMLKKKK